MSSSDAQKAEHVFSPTERGVGGFLYLTGSVGEGEGGSWGGGVATGRVMPSSDQRMRFALVVPWSGLLFSVGCVEGIFNY